MGWGVGVEEFRDVCDVGAVEPAMVKRGHEAVVVLYCVRPCVWVISCSDKTVHVRSVTQSIVLLVLLGRKDVSRAMKRRWVSRELLERGSRGEGMGGRWRV